MGICGEAGELLDSIKKTTIYNKELDIDNIVEELGDLEFYMEMIRQEIDLTREFILIKNISKLEKRYPNQYSDKDALERKDKAGE
jgi:NTP pyrophosphatase (non-canonical NTP hydrolase)